MRLVTSRKDFHRHSFEISPCGNGVTTLNLDHRHEIKGFIVHDVNGHSHILYGIPDKCMESSKSKKYYGNTSQSIEERSVNVYGEVPHGREYGDHRRVAAMKKLIYGISESVKVNEVLDKKFTVSGSDGYDGEYITDDETYDLLNNHDMDAKNQNFLSVFFLGLKTGKIENVNERAVNVYGEIPHGREYGDHRRVAAIKKLIYGEDK
jgi:hypothetical protein